MRLDNVLFGKGESPVDILLSGEKIDAINDHGKGDSYNNLSIHFENAAAFPGLINSHDHLDFNCFSPLGDTKYSNYKEWGRHIHTAYRKQIDAVLKIPVELRALWGMYKNLLAGVTTVLNHGAELNIINPLIDIIQDYQNLHSVGFEKAWQWKLNNPIHKNRICVIHTGEGTDEESHQEINALLRKNHFKRKIVGVHGVAMDPLQAKKFVGLVWCPASNDLLLGRHADIQKLKENTRIVFGTDSTLTGHWNIWEHVMLARSIGFLNDDELIQSLTSAPADLWKLNTGRLSPGKTADILIVKKNGEYEGFFSTAPENILMILHRGRIRMFDASVLPQLSDIHVCLYKFSRIVINGQMKFIEGDLPALMSSIQSYNTGIIFPAIIPGSIPAYA